MLPAPRAAKVLFVSGLRLNAKSAANSCPTLAGHIAASTATRLDMHGRITRVQVILCSSSEPGLGTEYARKATSITVLPKLEYSNE